MFKKEFLKKNKLELTVSVMMFFLVCFLMLIQQTAIVIFILFVLSFFMLLNSMNRYKKFSILSRNEKERYKIISQKPKQERSEEEENFYLQTQESFFSLFAAKYSFIFAVLLLILYKLFK
ncbi:hypothetical protein [Sulfurovum sp. AR]|uniref:hypothetical protein n=1 Tax=Sulfurovum sp. AR TaxID=1165841 RepID=UPI00025C48CC|nr:hypothetical protein [Sulfurovum sp. AR]EIF50498.1 hypothetical protein SULAR_08447 [Sulfurovum sp. AR]